MRGKIIRQLLLLCTILLLYFGFTRWKHKWDRPWAYASDTPVLIGKWQGQFKDPDGVSKQIELEIFEPQEKRWNRSRSKGKNGDASLRFTGSARVTSKLGVENDRIEGILGTSDGHLIKRVSFAPVDEKKQIPESFNVAGTEPGGTWQGDVIQLKISFNYRTKTGSSFWNSADARFNKKVSLTLYRKKQ